MKSSPGVEAQKPSAQGQVQSAEKTTKKKPYNTPVLKVYGNVEALTKTVENTSMSADGGAVLTKTH